MTEHDHDRRFLTRVVLRNYKSIAAADVSPAQVSFLVGPNGSGKSNFLDALRFVADSLRSTMDNAIHERGGINEVRRRSTGHPNHFGIRIDFRSARFQGRYAFTVGSKAGGDYEIREEECYINTFDDLDVSRRLSLRPTYDHYSVKNSKIQQNTLQVPPRAHPRRLYLVAVSGIEPFRQLYDAFLAMGFYNLIPEIIRDLQPPGPGDLLARDGRNAAGVLANLAARSPMFKKRIEDYLGRIVPGVIGVDRVVARDRETLEFDQDVKGAQHPWRFGATNMSDGTLRALGVLLALFQSGRDGFGLAQPFIGIEEPELALHPAATAVLLDALREAAQHSQVLVTSHSADLLDNVETSDDSVLAVVAEDGVTRIGPLDGAGRLALKEGLFTAGELLRVDQLIPDPDSTNLQPQQLPLFGFDEGGG